MISERKGPTRSEQTNQLIDLCQGVLDGRGSLEAMTQFLSQREEGLAQARADYLKNVSDEGERFAIEWADSIQLVVDGFDLYAAALATVRSYLSNQRPEALRQGIEELTRATERLLLALDFYDNRYMTTGPSDAPFINTLYRATEAVSRGEMPRENFQRLMAETHSFAERCIEELAAKAPPEIPADAVDRIRVGYQQFLDAIIEIEKFLTDSDHAHFQTGIAMAEQSQAAMKDGLETWRKESFEAGPTTSPIANTYVQAAAMMKQGKLDRAFFEQSLDRLDQHLNEVRRGFESLCRVPTESALIQEEIPRVLEAFDTHEEANAAYRRFLTSNNPADLDEGTEKLIAAMRQLDESKVALDRQSEQQGKIMCPRCFVANESYARVCASCGAGLPRVEHLQEKSSTFDMGEGGQVDADQEVVITENMARLIKESNLVLEGKITPEEYESTLQWMEGLLDNGERGLAAQPYVNPQAFPESERKKVEYESRLVEETKDMLREGIENARLGVQELRGFLVDGDQQHLIDGLRTLFEAQRQVYQVQRIGEVAARSIVSEEGPVSGGLETVRLDDEISVGRERDA